MFEAKRLKAIETIYNGYRFRSRLEARWAVFFDTLGIRYQYEPQGFELETGRYLPDFFLVDLETWCEVKPWSPSIEERRLAELLAMGTAQRVVFLAGEIPYPLHDDVDKWFTGFDFLPGKDSGGVSASDTFVCCIQCGGQAGWFTELITCGCGRCGGIIQYYSPFLTKAYAAARQARFEHGETPSTVKQSPQRIQGKYTGLSKKQSDFESPQ